MLCLLYGVSGVGKSRLLKQFVDSRLVQDRVVWVELDNAGNFQSFAGAKDKQRIEQFVQLILQPSEANSIFIIDQFEQAPPDIIAAILHYWQLEARLKNQKLVLASTPEKLKQLLQLSQKSGLSINSLELKPLSSREQNEFIRARCCPGHGQQPCLSRQQKLRLQQSQGLFSQLEILQKQWAGQIECRSRAQRIPLKYPLGLSLVVVLLVVVLWPGHLRQPAIDSIPATPAEVTLTDNAESPPATSSEDNVQPPTGGAIPDPAEQKKSAQSLLTEAVQLTEPPASQDHGASSEADSATLSASDNRVELANASDETISQQAADEEQADIEQPAILEKETGTVDSQPPASGTQLSPYRQRILASEQWLAESADSVSSIQIMLLGFEVDAEQSISQYLDRLLADGIDIDNIMLYLTTKNQRDVVGVLYGVYPNRQQASQQLRQLPDALKANKPLIRTVKGIRDEIISDRLPR